MQHRRQRRLTTATMTMTASTVRELAGELSSELTKRVGDTVTEWAARHPGGGAALAEAAEQAIAALDKALVVVKRSLAVSDGDSEGANAAGAEGVDEPETSVGVPSGIGIGERYPR